VETSEPESAAKNAEELLWLVRYEEMKRRWEEERAWRERHEPLAVSRGWRLLTSAYLRKWRAEQRLRQARRELARRVQGQSVEEVAEPQQVLPRKDVPEPPPYLVPLHKPNGHLVVGRHSYHDSSLVVVWPGERSRVIVGNFTSIANEVEIVPGGNLHLMNTVSTYPVHVRMNIPDPLGDLSLTTKGDVHVGNDVWIGRGAMILSGVTVGDGAVIGARAVVAKDVRPYAVVVGNPAREIRRRFSDDIVDALLSIKWWDWPDELIAQRADDLCHGSAGEFVARYRTS
jgi:acetyltransferase-like isoleucine patch superfamily enzyme